MKEKKDSYVLFQTKNLKKSDCLFDKEYSIRNSFNKVNKTNLINTLSIYFIFINLFSNFSIISCVKYENLIYKSYTPSTDGSNPDTHNLEIKFSLVSAISHPTDGTTDYKVSILRQSDNATENVQYKNNNPRNRRYLYYFMSITGIHSYSKPYVAYGITADCTGITTGNPAKISFIVKYFDCDSEAATFYTNSASANKVRFSSTQKEEETNTDGDYLTGDHAGNTCA